MRILDLLNLAFKNFFRRKMRTILTLLGVVIGSASVVVMVSISIAMDIQIKKNIESWGDLSLVSVNSWGTYDRETGEWKESIPLTQSSMEEFRALPNVIAVTPMMNEYIKLVSGKYVYSCNVYGIDPEAMPYIKGMNEVEEGALLEVGDDNAIVLGYEIAYSFYNPKKNNNNNNMGGYYFYGGGTSKEYTEEREKVVDPMNAPIKMTFDWSYGEQMPPPQEGQPIPKQYKPKLLEVKGTLKRNNDNPWESSNAYMDYRVLMELKKEYNKFMGITDQGNGMDMSSGSGRGSSKKKEQTFQEIRVKVDDITNAKAVTETIKNMGYTVNDFNEYIEQIQKESRNQTIILLLVGSVAFFVAALNIINTMLMSMYERTREIGIMKVLGCKLADVRNLFLFEAGFIGFIGGAIGSLGSAGVSTLINFLNEQNQKNSPWYYEGMEIAKTSIVPLWLILVGTGVAVLIAIISGYYPSLRAMKLSTLAAIKNE